MWSHFCHIIVRRNEEIAHRLATLSDKQKFTPDTRTTKCTNEPSKKKQRQTQRQERVKLREGISWCDFNRNLDVSNRVEPAEHTQAHTAIMLRWCVGGVHDNDDHILMMTKHWNNKDYYARQIYCIDYDKWKQTTVNHRTRSSCVTNWMWFTVPPIHAIQ